MNALKLDMVNDQFIGQILQRNINKEIQKGLEEYLPVVWRQKEWFLLPYSATVFDNL